VVFFGLTFAQSIASNPNNSTNKEDPSDCGFQSAYLASLGDNDNVVDDERARIEATMENRGCNPNFTEQMLQEAAKERVQFGDMLPGAAQREGALRWMNIGPIHNDYIQNGVTLQVTDSGRLRTILPHPEDPDIVYVLTSSGGLWKTTNFTDQHPHWEAKTDRTVTTSGGAAAFGRQPEIVYVGTSDPFDGRLGTAFVLKTADGGESFAAPVILPNATSIRDVKVDKSARHDIVFAATDFGLYVSRDGGRTFTRAADPVFDDSTPFGVFSKTVWSIAQTRAGWIASTENPFVGDPSTDGAGSLVMSTDHGVTWQPIANRGNVFAGAGRTTLGIGRPGDKTVYAFAANTGDGQQLDLFRSDDGGQNWTALNLPAKVPLNPNPDQPNMDVMEGQAFYNQMLLVDPTDRTRNTVYLGGQLSSVKTTDGGNTWTVIANWLAQFSLPYVHADYHAAAIFVPSQRRRDDDDDDDRHNHKPPTIFFGTDGGLFVSQDGGQSFDNQKNTGIVSLLGYSINSNPENPESAIMGLQDNGTFVRRGDSKIWEQPIGGDGLGTAWSQANQDFVLGTVEFSTIFRSTAVDPLLQNQFTRATKGINRGPAFRTFFTALATPSATADSSGSVFFTFTKGAVYRTTDGAANWVNIGQNGLAGATPSPGIAAARRFRDTVHGIGVSPSPGDGLNHMGVVASAGWVIVTHDGGATWHQTPLIGTIPGWQGFNSNVEFADNNTLYVGSESPFPGARIAKSTDGGLTFTDVTNNLPNIVVNRIRVSTVDPNTLFAATFLGVYRSTDGGTTWARFGHGLPQVEVRDIYMPPDGSFLRIATYGRGVWDLKF
jgi:photosystem II stability/assembly factor-like uncharacterized protein